MLWNMAFRYLTGRKLRSVLTTLAVIFGVMVIFGMNILIPSMMQGFQANIMAASGLVDVNITHKTGGSFDPGIADQVKSVSGVSAVTVSLNRTVNLPADFYDHDPAKVDKITTLGLIGVDVNTAQSVRAYMLQSGRFLQADDRDAAIISQSLADNLGLKLGNTLPMPSTSGVVNLKIVGILPPHIQTSNEEVQVTLAQAQGMMDQAGKINAMDVNFNTSDVAQRDQIKQNIETMLGADYQIGSLPSGSEAFASIKAGQAVFNIFGFLALFMGGFIIFNTFRTIVAERRHDIGLLRAIGASRRTVVSVILIEGLLQGIIGTAIGMLLGYLIGAGALSGLSQMMSSFIHIQISGVIVSPGLVVLCIVAGVGVTVLAGLIPALQASRVTPMEALRPSAAEVENRRWLTPGFVIGAICLGGAFIMLFSKDLGIVLLGSLLFLTGLVLVSPALVRPIAILFGALFNVIFARQGIGQLAEGNLTRQPSRVAITASTTLIAMAIVVAAGTMTTSISGSITDLMHKTLGSDYLFVPPSIAIWSSDMGASQNFTTQLQGVDGVGDISAMRYASSKYQQVAVSVLGIDPVNYPKVSGFLFSEGGDSAYPQLTQGRTMIANDIFLASAGVKVGDTIHLSTMQGEKPYKIIASAADLLNMKVNTAYISQENLKTDFGVTEDIFIQLNLKPGADKNAADTKVRAVAANYPQFNLISGKAYYESLSGTIDAVFMGMYVLLAMLALPSLIAILNTLAIGVIERTREIGMLRAVGATRSQIYRLIVMEALLLASLGTAFGILGGLYLGYVTVRGLTMMMPVAYSFPLPGVIAAIVIGLLFGFIAAIIPARQAARLGIVQALRYE